MTPEEIRERLINAAEPAYRDFNASLLPGVSGILGVRLPAIRKIAKELAKEDWRGWLEAARDEFFEEIMLRGMVIGFARAPLAEKLVYVKDFIPRIGNWAVCDSFCAALKCAREERGALWAFVKPYFCSEKEFDVRFAAVMSIFHFTDEEHLPELLSLLSSFAHGGYYAKMAAAWAVSACFAKFPGETFAFLAAAPEDTFTRRKSLQKILESRLVSPQWKEKIRALRKTGRQEN